MINIKQQLGKIVFIIIWFVSFANSEGMQSKTKITSVGGGSGSVGKDFSRESQFTGDVSFPASLAVVGSVDIKLQYNSNVYKQVRVDNRVSPSGLVGLGWSLQIGTIIGDINNTPDTIDDRYYFDGMEILQDTLGVFRMQEFMAWKIKRVINTAGIIIGWEILKEDGTIYRFGNYIKDSSKFSLSYSPTYATRCKLGFFGWAGNPQVSDYDSASLIPYQWDLSDIEDVMGNHTSITYQQEQFQLSLGSNATSLYYTRESHPFTISDNTGGLVEFVLGDMNTDEYDGDTESYNQNIFGKKYLEGLKLKQNGILFKQIMLTYQSWDTLHIGAKKRYLSGITISDNYGKILPINEYSYCGSESVNPGALRKISFANGGSIEYSYRAQPLGNVKLNYKSITIENQNSICTNYSGNTLSFLNKTGLSGKDFFVVFGRANLMFSESENYNSECPTYQKIKVFCLGPKGWYQDSTFNEVSGYDSAAFCQVGHDYILINNFALIRRTPMGWKRYNLNDKLVQAGGTIGYNVSVIGTGPDFIVLKHNRRQNGNYYLNDVSVIKLFPNGIRIDTVGKDYEDIRYISPINSYTLVYFGVKTDCGNNYFVITSHMPGGNGYVDTHLKWQNGKWVKLINRLQVQFDNELSFTLGTYPSYCYPARLPQHSIGSNFITTVEPLPYCKTQTLPPPPCYYDPPKSNIFVYSHTGKNLVKVDSLLNVQYVQSSNANESYFVVNGFPNVGGTSFVMLWNGNKLDSTWYTIANGFFGTSAIGIRNRILFNINRVPPNAGGMQLLGKAIYTGHSFIQGQLIDSSNVYSPDGDRFAGFNFADQNMFLFEWKDNGNSFFTKLKSYYFVGDSVRSVMVDSIYAHMEATKRFWQSGDHFVASVDDSTRVNSPYTTKRIISAYSCANDSTGINIFTGSPWDYVIESKKVFSGTGDSLVTIFKFENGVYDENMNFAKYNKVSIIPPGNNGKSVQYYYNDLDSSTALNFIDVSSFNELDGEMYREEIFSQTDTVNPLIRTLNYHKAILVSDSVLCIYRKQLDSTNTTKFGVSTASYYTYNTTNGMVQQKKDIVGVRDSVSTKKDLLTEIVYAYETNSGMLAKNMLTQVAEQRISSVSSTAIQLISKNLTEYTTSGSFVPKANKVYDGTKWLTTDTIIFRDSRGNVKESENVNNVRTVTKWGYSNTVPIATIVNATDVETKVEICEQFNSVSGGLLAENFSIYNPINTSLTLSSVTRGLSDNCQKVVTGYSDTAPVGIYINTGNLNSSKNYIIEYDFMVTGGTMEVYTSSGSTNISQSSYSASSHKKKWYHGKILWNLGGNGSNSKVYFRSLWFDQETNPATYYVDNIRIYPADAVCTSQTYHPLTFDVISVTDENGVTRYAATDGFGRTTTVLK